MRKALILAAARAMLGFAGSASAQSRGSDASWWPWAGGQYESGLRGSEQGRRNDDNDRDDRGKEKPKDKAARNNRDIESGRNGNGPPFCRSGQGHPTKGMAWCRDKGWANWDRASWGDVILRSPRRPASSYDQSTLSDILGRVVFGRLTGYANQLGVRSPIYGRTLDLGRQGSVLQVRVGDVPLAEFTDFNRDGRVDLVLLAGH